MDIVDSHVHLWDPAAASFSWLDGLPSLQGLRAPADYLSTAAGLGSVSAFVVVEGGAEARDARKEVEWLLRQAETCAYLAGIVAQVPVEQGEAIAEHVDWLTGHPLVKGVRRNLQGEDLNFCLQPEFMDGLTLVAEAGLSFDLCIRHEQLPAVTSLVRQMPEVTFVLDHVGKPPVAAGEREVWAGRIRDLAQRPNISCKLSGLATEAAPGEATPEKMLPYLRSALKAFGWNRIMFGTDWPVCELATTVDAWASVIEELLVDATPAQREAVMGGNARRIYRL